jgi:hypothetical protein
VYHLDIYQYPADISSQIRYTRDHVWFIYHESLIFYGMDMECTKSVGEKMGSFRPSVNRGWIAWVDAHIESFEGDHGLYGRIEPLPEVIVVRGTNSRYC